VYVTLSDIAADITRNACESGADTVELEIMEVGTEFRFLVRDNGKGMSNLEAARAINPFGTEHEADGAQKTGVSLPFLVQTVNEAAGSWDLHTEKGVGTTVSVRFTLDNVETPTVGDLAVLFCAALAIPGPREFIVRRLRKTGVNDVRYELRKTELSAALGGLDDADSQTLLRTYLQSLEQPAETYGNDA
jgi:hypothetical protein